MISKELEAICDEVADHVTSGAPASTYDLAMLVARLMRIRRRVAHMEAGATGRLVHLPSIGRRPPSLRIVTRDDQSSEA